MLVYKGKGSPYSIIECSELIPVLGSQPAGENAAVGCHYFPSGLQLPTQPLTGLLPNRGTMGANSLLLPDSVVAIAI